MSYKKYATHFQIDWHMLKICNTFPTMPNAGSDKA